MTSGEFVDDKWIGIIGMIHRNFQAWGLSSFPKNVTHDESKQLDKVKNTKLTLAINACPPNIMINVSASGIVTLDKGPEVELLKLFQQKFNFIYDIKLPADGEWGRRVNGEWTGLIGMILQNKADVASGCITLTAPRHKVVSFSALYDIQKSVIVTRKPKVKSKVYAVLMPFSIGVWVGVLCSLLSFTVVLYSIEQCYTIMFRKKTLQFGKIFWYLLGSFSSEGGKLGDVIGSAAVTVVGFWLIFVLIIQTCYSGTLMRVLSVQNEEPAINTMSDVATIVKEQGFKCGCIKGTIHQAIIMELTGRLAIIKETMLQDKTTLVHSVRKGLVKVLNENYVFLAQESECRYVAGKMKEGNFYMSRESLDYEIFGFVFEKEFPYAEDFNIIIRKAVEAGLIEKWRRDLTFKHNDEIFHSTTKSVAAVPLTITEMHGALIMCIYGLTLATLVLIAEQIQSKMRKVKLRKKPKYKIAW